MGIPEFLSPSTFSALHPLASQPTHGLESEMIHVCAQKKPINAMRQYAPAYMVKERKQARFHILKVSSRHHKFRGVMGLPPTLTVGVWRSEIEIAKIPAPEMVALLKPC